jgi:hypothetical protein
MYNILIQYIDILDAITWLYIHTIYKRLLSVQTQYSRSCPIFSSFRLWILVIILLYEIWGNFCNGHYFLLLWHCTLNCCTAATILNILLSIGKLFTFGDPTSCPACSSCWCKGTGILGSILAGPGAIQAIFCVFYKTSAWTTQKIQSNYPNFRLSVPPLSLAISDNQSNMHSSSPHSCYMPCLSHPPWIDHSNYVWRGVQVMKLLVMQFLPISRHFTPPRLNWGRAMPWWQGTHLTWFLKIFCVKNEAG